jgi:mono/diheme cytochrome c family protein
MQRVYLSGLAAVLLAGLAACDMPAPAPTGQADFATYCAACHGQGAQGAGPATPTLTRTPPDLTTLARRNGGVFPGTRVMAKVWGRGGGPAHASDVMPGFGPLLDSDLVPYDGGDGIATPTPLRLVQIAEYLKSVQAP